MGSSKVNLFVVSNCINIEKRKRATKIRRSIFDVFLSPEIRELRTLVDNRGYQCFDTGELFEIDKMYKQGKVDISTIKYFSHTMLDAKSMAEIYSYGNRVENRHNEYKAILDKIKEFEEPYANLADSVRHDLHTKFKNEEDFNDKPTYQITNALGNKVMLGGENNHIHSEMTLTGGSYYPSEMSEDYVNIDLSIAS